RQEGMLRMVGVGSSREANKVQATAAKAMAPAPSGQAVAIQKKAQMPIATAAASADNSAMPASVCIGLGPISAAAARISDPESLAGSSHRQANGAYPQWHFSTFAQRRKTRFWER